MYIGGAHSIFIDLLLYSSTMIENVSCHNNLPLQNPILPAVLVHSLSNCYPLACTKCLHAIKMNHVGEVSWDTRMSALSTLAWSVKMITVQISLSYLYYVSRETYDSTYNFNGVEEWNAHEICTWRSWKAALYRYLKISLVLATWKTLPLLLNKVWQRVHIRSAYFIP